MAGVFGDYSQLFRLFHASGIKRFVRRENPERELQLKKKKFSDTSGEEDSMFVAETASLLDSQGASVLPWEVCAESKPLV